MAARLLSFLPIATSTCGPSSPALLFPSSIDGNKFLIKKANMNSLVRKHSYSTALIISLSLPISEKLKASTNELPKWSARAIKSFGLGRLESRKLKYPEFGTEGLLMGILVEGTSLAAKFLRENGITLIKVQEGTVDLLGRSEVAFSSPEFPPLTIQAQQALDWAVQEKLKSGEPNEITTTYLLLGLWAQKQSAAHMVLAALGFNNEKVAELSKSMNKDFSFR